MQFHAASIGSAVPRDKFNATIQSLFDSSLNLRLDVEDRLITILISDHHNLPQGIRVDNKIPIQQLTVGLKAASRGGILRFDSSNLSIDLRWATIWDGKLSTLTGYFGQAWSIVWQTLNEGQRQNKTELNAEDLFRSDKGSLLTRKFRQSVQKLLNGAKSYDSRISGKAAHEMIGLGPGVTPSGDDLLIGFLAGLQSMAGNITERRIFIETFGNEISLYLRETNEISRTYIQHAIHGEFSSSIVTLIEAIQSNEEEILISNTKNAMRVGHSSGMDSITGLLIGLASWETISINPDHKELIL